MKFFGDDTFSLHSASEDDEFLIKQLLLTHDPDGRRLDSELLLRAMEDVMRYTTISEVPEFGSHLDVSEQEDIRNIEIAGSKEKLAQIICRILNEFFCEGPGKGNLHARTMVLFDLLGKYGWDAKVVLTLAAFVTCYGEFWLILQLYPCHPLAASVAMLRQFPVNLSSLKPQFKALSLLVKTIVDVIKCIIKFEGLPFRFVKLDDEAMITKKSCFYTAAYWVARSILACSSQIKDLKANNPEQVHVPSLLSTNKLKNLYCTYVIKLDMHQHFPEVKMYQKLSESFQEAHDDNQEVLGMLLALKDDLPLKDCSTQAKVGVSELKEKVVVLLISKPELLPLECLLLLVQQTDDHPHNRPYQIVWIPISASDAWNHSELEMFKFLSNYLSWYSIRKPWAMSSVIVKYIKQEWYCKDDNPIMVVLDSQGKVSHSNAIDMVLLWGGARTYPFSYLKEEELWVAENWTLQLLLDEIDPLLSRWVEEGRNICLYGSDSLEWVREFNAKLKPIRSSGVQLEVLYVGDRNINEKVRHILAIINEEMHSSLLSITKINFFWLRLECMRRSKLRQGRATDSDHILAEVTALLDSDGQGWAVVGTGTTVGTIKLQGSDGIECLSRFPVWGENVAKLGLLGALKSALEPTPVAGPCYHCEKVPYADGSMEGTVLCSNCSRPMKKYIIYE
ncbi:hypothetical protein Tsubulata_042470 [Turnera subulata]|uniref:Sieve element occlusion N-terminal domain-containing protein n=1 Tax=Turnera subulata TaxID=218843 RepID=A0A9Q0GFC7_9ROSI|nr:hypothetical protein Tsubulata_042470 [Turnera subulata]